MHHPRHTPYHIWRDAAIIALSIVVALILTKTRTLEAFLLATGQTKLAGSFIAGLFFTTAFTTAPAVVALAEIAKTTSLFPMALAGAAGAMIGDFVIFRFIKDSVFEDLQYLLWAPRTKRWAKIFRLRLFRWSLPLLGALIIASPLPGDELGVALLGLSKTNTRLFLVIAFLFNFLGILLIAWVSRAVGG